MKDNCTPKPFRVSPEVSFFRKKINEIRCSNQLAALHQKATWVSLYWLFLDICIIILCSVAFYLSPLLFPVCGVLAGSSMKAMTNHCHDASHNNIFKELKYNRWLAKFFLMPLMFLDYKIYHLEHGLHHGELASKCDPDAVIRIPDIKSSYSDIRSFLIVILPDIFNFKFWVKSTFGWLFKVKGLARVYILLWWLGLFTAISALFGLTAGTSFLIFWFLTRATVFHLIKVYDEACDHAYLNGNSIVKATRSMPNNLLTPLLYPENDNFHIAHHLFPGIPMPNLKEAHKLLMNIKEYRDGEHLNAFFFGKNSVLKSLIGRNKAVSIVHPEPLKPVLMTSMAHYKMNPEKEGYALPSLASTTIHDFYEAASYCSPDEWNYIGNAPSTENAFSL